MKYLFIITRADTIGGAQVHVRDICNALGSLGNEVLVVTGAPGVYTDDLALHRIPFHVCPSLCQKINPINDWKALRCLGKIIHQFQPDLISTHSSKAGILGRVVARIHKTPCLFTAHGWSFTDGVPQPTRRLYELIERSAAPLAAQIICVSDYDRHLAIRLGINPNRLKTIHNGMPNITLPVAADMGTDDEVKIVMIARFGQQKDHATLIKAFQGVSGARLIFVGDGPSLGEMKSLAEDLGLSQKVDFLGFRKDIPQILAQAQVFALISHWEGFPRTIIEAMRAGLPVVASDVGGAAEAIVEGISGFAVPRSDVETLRDRLCRLVTNAQLRAQMGQAARQLYEEAYTFDRMFAETYQTYEAILQRSKSKP